MCSMQHSEDKEVFESELADFWFDDDRILCSYAKKANRTLEKQKETYQLIRKITGNKKVCYFSDDTFAGPQDQETREYVAREMPDLFKAMAVLADSTMATLLVDTFINFSGHPIPIQVFTNEQEAKKWLKQYL